MTEVPCLDRLCKLPLVAMALLASPLMADSPAACVDKLLADTISCIGIVSRPGQSKGNRANSQPDACRALADWRKYLATLRTVDAPTAATTAMLEAGCTNQDNVVLADRLRQQGRFDEAFNLYDKIQADKTLPWVIESARRGRIASTEQKTSLFGPPPAVAALERQSKFEAAYQALSKVVPGTDAHRKNLLALLVLSRQSADLVRRDQPEVALKAFDTYLATLDSVRDRFLVDAATSQINLLKSLARKEAGIEAEALVNAGDLQRARGQFTDAATSYEKALQKRSDLDPLLASETNAKLAEARRRAAEEPSLYGTWLTFLAAIVKFALALLGWALYFLTVAAAIVVLWWLWRRRTRAQILLSMQDLVAGASNQNNQLLSDQMRREMQPKQPDKDKNLIIDTPGEMDGSSLGQLGIRVPLSAAATAVEANSQVALGPFSFNPVQLFNQLRPLFRPRYKIELQGSVSKLGSDVLCSVSTVRGELVGTWEAVGSGDSAQDQAVRDVVAQVLIAIDEETRKITANWRSLSRMRQGMDFLRMASNDTAQRQDLWKQARGCFQESVLEDPANWLARFNLGTVLRKLGLNSLAAEQFGELQHPPTRLPEDYLQVVKYNQAAALQKADDEKLANRALRILDEILTSGTLDPLLERLAKSGRLAARADRLARRQRRLQRSDEVERQALKKEVDAALAEGGRVLADVKLAVETRKTSDGANDNVVLAVTLNALGQLEGLLNKSLDARELYRRALTLLPSFIEPNLNLAALYLEKKTDLDDNWAIRAERLLKDVKEIDPTNTRCLVLLGTLYSKPVFGRVEEAIAALKQALPDPDAGLRLGGILFEQGNPGDAVAPLRSSVGQDAKGGDSGRILLARCALALPADDRRKCPLLNDSQSWLKRIQAGTGSKSHKKDAADLLPLVLAALVECSKSPTPAAQAPPTEPSAPPPAGPPPK